MHHGGGNNTEKGGRVVIIGRGGMSAGVVSVQATGCVGVSGDVTVCVSVHVSVPVPVPVSGCDCGCGCGCGGGGGAGCVCVRVRLSLSINEHRPPLPRLLQQPGLQKTLTVRKSVDFLHHDGQCSEDQSYHRTVKQTVRGDYERVKRMDGGGGGGGVGHRPVGAEGEEEEVSGD